MKNIEFLSNLKVPHINTDSMVISGDLTVKGDTIVEKTVDKVIEGAVSVINSTNETALTTMLGQVILTGSINLNGTCYFKDTISSISTAKYGKPVSYLLLANTFYINDTCGLYLEWVDSNPDDPDAQKILRGISDATGMPFTLYDSKNGGWDDSYKTQRGLIFDNVAVPKYLYNWLTENIDNHEECLTISDYTAYAILYDPVTDAVRLGRGTYDLTAENPTFDFFEGEGTPVAVRDLTTSDDGSFVMWDAKKYCLVKTPMKVGSNEGAITMGVGTNWQTSEDGDSYQYSAPKASGIGAFAGGRDSVIGWKKTYYGWTDVVAHTSASGDASFAFGTGANASGDSATALGLDTKASGMSAFAGGKQTIASGETSAAFGNQSIASGEAAAAFGTPGTATNYTFYEYDGTEICVDVDPSETKALGEGAFATGCGTLAKGKGSSAEGISDNIKSGGYSYYFDAGDRTIELTGELYGAFGEASHVEGYNTTADALAAHAEGRETKAFSEASHAEGLGSLNWVATFELVESTDPTIVSDTKFKLINGAIPYGADYDNLLRVTLVSRQTGTQYAVYTTTYGDQGDIFHPFITWSVYKDSSASTRIEPELELGKFDVFIEASNSAGLRGYYIWGIDAENKIITLAQTKEEAMDSSNEPTAFNIQYKTNDLISICGDYEYPNFTYILNIENNKIEVGELPIYYTNTNANGEYNYTHWSNEATTFVNNTVYCLQKPDIGNVDLGAGAHVEGVNNVAYGQGAHAEGYDNKALGSQAHVEGSRNTAGYCAHAEGKGNQAVGKYAHAEGRNVVAGTNVTDVAHAEGNNTKATGEATHAEGHSTTASGWYSHAEGHSSVSSGQKSHAEGANTVASGTASHAEGSDTEAIGDRSHAEGSNTHATQTGTHAEGYGTTASGWYSHAEGQETTASGNHSHSEGISTTASNEDAHAEGYHTTASGKYSHAQGQEAVASGTGAHAEGWKTNSTHLASHAEGRDTRAYSNYGHTEGYNTETKDGADAAHAEGYSTKAHGHSSHAEGRGTEATGAYSHAGGNGAKAGASSAFAHGTNVEATGEASAAFGLSGTNYDDGQTVWKVEASGQGSFAAGMGAKAKGIAAHAEGRFAQAIANYTHAEGYFTSAGNSNTDSVAAHAEGYMTTAGGHSSHAEGRSTKALGNYSHAEGRDTTAQGEASHAGGNNSIASGLYSFAHGLGVKTAVANQVVFGTYNQEESEALFIIGNGSSSNDCKNAFVVAPGKIKLGDVELTVDKLKKLIKFIDTIDEIDE